MYKKLASLLVAGAAAMGAGCLISLGLSSPPKSAASSPWIASPLTLGKDGDLVAGTPIPFSFNGNRDCVDHEFVTRPGSFPFSLSQSEIRHLACGVQSNYGIVDPNGWLELNGTHTAGKLVNYSGYAPGSIPVPGSSTLINYTSGPSGLFLHFTKNLPAAITASAATNGEVTYQVNRPGDVSLRDRANTILPTQPDSLSFSGNGRWLVVDGRNRAVLRVNTETLEVLPFAPTFNYSIGLNPGVQTAITGDGQYAVVYSKNFGVFNLYDLATCVSVPISINAPVPCQSRDLLSIMQQQLPGLQSISRIRFIDDNTLSFYANYYAIPGVSSSNKIAKFRLSTAIGSVSSIELLALGDSYISGEGTFEYRAGTDITDNRCHLSMQSYPLLAASELGLNSYSSVACSGARTGHITDTLIPESPLVKPQAKGKVDSDSDQEIFVNYLPGYRAQLVFVEINKPKRILLSVGGNDIGFSKILRRCLEPDTCYSTYEDRLELVREVNGTFPELVETYTKIKQEGVPGAKIYAVGYPQIALPGGSCGLNVRLNTQELEFARLITSYLNSVIKKATERAGVGYADAENALNGHRLCEIPDEAIAVNGLTAGDNTPSFLRGPIGNESYHPNKLGHQLLSESVLSGTQNLTLNMPAADSSSIPPVETNLEILNAPKTNRPINKINYDENLANDIVYREVWWDIYLKTIEFSFKKLSPLDIVLNSEPVNLGTFKTDASGDLSAQIRIPATVPTGFHTLHVYGTNLANEPIDIYKTIYVAANESDYDADGLANTVDSCDTLPNSGVDRDQDGVDDACDGFIGTAPVVTTVASSVVLTESEAEARNGDAAPEPEQEEADNNALQESAPANKIQGSLDEQEGFVISESTEPGQPIGGSVENNGLRLPAPGKMGLAVISIFLVLVAAIFGKLTNLWKPA